MLKLIEGVRRDIQTDIESRTKRLPYHADTAGMSSLSRTFASNALSVHNIDTRRRLHKPNMKIRLTCVLENSYLRALIPSKVSQTHQTPTMMAVFDWIRYPRLLCLLDRVTFRRLFCRFPCGVLNSRCEYDYSRALQGISVWGKVMGTETGYLRLVSTSYHKFLAHVICRPSKAGFVQAARTPKRSYTSSDLMFDVLVTFCPKHTSKITRTLPHPS